MPGVMAQAWGSEWTTMADVTVQTTCINLQAGGGCCLRESPCPYAGMRGEALSVCGEARLAARVHLAPDEFVVLMTPAGRPGAGRFPVRRCRVTTVEEAAGVHTTSLLTSRGDAALLDAMETGKESVLLMTRDGNASLAWKAGKFIPA